MKLVVGTNSYVTVNEADKIVENYFTSTDADFIKYDNLDDEDKSIILYKSCLDMQKLKYRGLKSDNSQKLAFPRKNRVGYASDDDMVKLAQVINSLSFIDSESTTSQVNEMVANGVSRFQLGSFAITLGNGASSSKSNSGKVETLLSEWLTGGVPLR